VTPEGVFLASAFRFSFRRRRYTVLHFICVTSSAAFASEEGGAVGSSIGGESNGAGGGTGRAEGEELVGTRLAPVIRREGPRQRKRVSQLLKRNIVRDPSNRYGPDQRLRIKSEIQRWRFKTASAIILTAMINYCNWFMCFNYHPGL
jgi:hypothetical protein